MQYLPTAPSTSARWVERIDAVETFKDLLPSIVSCFDSISAGSWSADSLTDASTFVFAITTTDYISALVITSNSLRHLTKACRLSRRTLLKLFRRLKFWRQKSKQTGRSVLKRVKTNVRSSMTNHRLNSLTFITTSKWTFLKWLMINFL